MSTELSDKVFFRLLHSGEVKDQVYDELIFLDFNRYAKHVDKLVLHLSFQNVKFKGGLILQNFTSDKLNAFEFYDCEIDYRFILTELHFPNALIEFINCSVSCEITQLLRSTFLQTTIIGCNFNRLIFDDKCKIEGLYIQNASISKDLVLHDIQVNDFGLETNQNKVKIVKLNSLAIESATILAKTKIDELQIYDAQSVTVQGEIGRVDVSIASFEKLEFADYVDTSPKASKIANKIDCLFIVDFNYEGQIIFHRYEIGEMNLINVSSPSGLFRLNEVSIHHAAFADCTIHDFYWNQVEFVNPPDIVRCDLAKLKMANVIWPKDKALGNSFLKEQIPIFYSWRKLSNNGFDKENISELRYQRDTYRQLKAASIANHNTTEALDFYKNEMRLFWKEIRITGGVDWQDRFLVFLGRFSSNFGQSWLLPLMWLLLFHFILFACIMNGFWWNSMSGGDEFGQFWVLLNPVHKTPEYINTGAGLFTEFSMRVFNGYFIYHLIRATRKFGKL